MRIISIKRKNLMKFTVLFVFLITVFTFSVSFGMQNYYKLDFSTGLVIASQLNVRSGPGTQYKTVTTVGKNQYIRVFAGVGDWYIVQVEGDYVGAVNKKYVKAIYSKASGTPTTNSNNTTTNTTNNTVNNTNNSLMN